MRVSKWQITPRLSFKPHPNGKIVIERENGGQLIITRIEAAKLAEALSEFLKPERDLYDPINWD